MEQEREPLTRELERKNRDLENLIYAASHDLRSPLINIEGFSRRLEQICQALMVLLDHPVLPATVRQRFAEITQTQIPQALLGR